MKAISHPNLIQNELSVFIGDAFNDNGSSFRSDK